MQKNACCVWWGSNKSQVRTNRAAGYFPKMSSHYMHWTFNSTSLCFWEAASAARERTAWCCWRSRWRFLSIFLMWGACLMNPPEYNCGISRPCHKVVAIWRQRKACHWSNMSRSSFNRLRSIWGYQLQWTINVATYYWAKWFLVL
jgi:hypothetical protein